MNGDSVSFIVAFFAGIMTFLSPCLLPLIPSFILYITGVSFSDLKNEDKKRDIKIKAVKHSIFFILGFSAVFISLGLTATLLGKLLFKYQSIIRTAGGLLIIIFGLYLLGILKLDFLSKERKFKTPPKGLGYFGSFLVGVTFAAAWTPCAGPILGSILVLAGTKTSISHGAILLSVYSLGLGIPFLIAGVAINFFLEHFKKFEKVLRAVNVAGGILLVMVGIMLATNYFSVVSRFVLKMF